VKKQHWVEALSACVCWAVLMRGVPAEDSLAGMASAAEDGGASAWRGWKAEGLPAGWHIAHGVLSKTGSVDDLVTNLSLEISSLNSSGRWAGRHSGLFYRGTREYDHIYWSAPNTAAR